MYGTTIRDLKAVFDSIDKDGSGALDHDEFAHAMRKLPSYTPNVLMRPIYTQ
jgi:Ca2+-binding EF-hand superfamily protein